MLIPCGMSVEEDIRVGGNGVHAEELAVHTGVLVPSVVVIMLIYNLVKCGSCAHFRGDVIEVNIRRTSVTTAVITSSLSTGLMSRIAMKSRSARICRGLRKSLEGGRGTYKVTFLCALCASKGGICCNISSSRSTTGINSRFSSSCTRLRPIFNKGRCVRSCVSRARSKSLVAMCGPVRSGTNGIITVLKYSCSTSSVTTRLRGTIIRALRVKNVYLVLTVLVLAVVIDEVAGKLVRMGTGVCSLMRGRNSLARGLSIEDKSRLRLVTNGIGRLLTCVHGVVVKVSSKSVQLVSSSHGVISRLDSTSRDVASISTAVRRVDTTVRRAASSLGRVARTVSRVCSSMRHVTNGTSTKGISSRRVRDHTSKTGSTTTRKRGGTGVRARGVTSSLGRGVTGSGSIRRVRVLASGVVRVARRAGLLTLGTDVRTTHTKRTKHNFTIITSRVKGLTNGSTSTTTGVHRIDTRIVRTISRLTRKSRRVVRFIHGSARRNFKNLITADRGCTASTGTVHTVVRRFTRATRRLHDAVSNVHRSVSTIGVTIRRDTGNVTKISRSSMRLANGIGSVRDRTSSGGNVTRSLTARINGFGLR